MKFKYYDYPALWLTSNQFNCLIRQVVSRYPILEAHVSFEFKGLRIMVFSEEKRLLRHAQYIHIEPPFVGNRYDLNNVVPLRGTHKNPRRIADSDILDLIQDILEAS